MSADLAEMLRLLARFSGDSLTKTLARIEAQVEGVTADRAPSFLEGVGAARQVLGAAAEMKRLAGQINVTIHALGILFCLPHILEVDETVEYVSLGAGNTGRKFDLETNLRVAEFKFISWRGGSEAIRQNSIFKDYFLLADTPTSKRKCLYLLGTEHPLKFFNGGRAVTTSVLSRDDKTKALFLERFGGRYPRVRDYFQAHRHEVELVDVSGWLRELSGVPLLQETAGVEE